MKRITLAAACLALVGALAAGETAGAGQVPAGEPDPLPVPVTLNYFVAPGGGDPFAVADGLTPELYTSTGVDVTASTCSGVSPTTGPSNLVTMQCTVPVGDYVVGVSGVPATHYVYIVLCRSNNIGNEAIDHPTAEFTAVGPTTCDVYVNPLPQVGIDKAVTGGAAVASDFTVEVYTTTGELVTTVVDPSAESCTTQGLDPAKCGVVSLLPGTYVLGEQSEYGYVAETVNCFPIFAQDTEIFPSELGEFSHGVKDSDTICTVTNSYYESVVSADVVVVNDSGGLATGADFTIEVYDDMGALVDSGQDPEPGTGNMSAEFTLPIGDYQFGVSGPDGYTASVVVTVSEVPVEIIDDPTAQFSLGVFEVAEGVITVNDPTTTTTSAPTTTIAPTTTEIGGVLPPTGDDDAGVMALLALGLVLFGAGAVFASRRT